TGLSRHAGSTPLYSVRVIGDQRDTKELSGVSHVDRDGKNTLEIKSLAVAIATFETRPEHALCSRHCLPLDRGCLDGIGFCRKLPQTGESCDSPAMHFSIRDFLGAHPIVHGKRKKAKLPISGDHTPTRAEV